MQVVGRTVLKCKLLLQAPSTAAAAMMPARSAQALPAVQRQAAEAGAAGEGGGAVASRAFAS